MRRKRLQCLAILRYATPDEITGNRPGAAHGDFLCFTRHGVEERDRDLFTPPLDRSLPNDDLLFLPRLPHVMQYNLPRRIAQDGTLPVAYDRL